MLENRDFCRAAVALLVVVSAVEVRGSYAPGCTVALESLPGMHQAQAMVLQPDGKIIVAGYVETVPGRDFFVARFHPDLTLDTSFNGTGYRVDDLLGRNDEAFALALTPDQRIVVAGYSQATANKYYSAFARYHRDGTPDTSFDLDGFVFIDFNGSQNDRARAVAVQPDGKIVGAGFLTSSGQQLAVVRLTTIGDLDPAFGSGGSTQPTLGSSTSFATDVLVDPDGRIVISGEGLFTTSDFLAVRLRSDGSLDTTFNGIGWRSIDLGGGDSASSLILEPNGDLVLGGTTNGNFAALRLTSIGSPVTTFFHDFGGNDVGMDVALDAASNIVVAGETSSPAIAFAFARFPPGGGAPNLARVHDITPAEDRSFAVAITRTGKILLAGSSSGFTNRKLTLSLFNSDGSQDCTGTVLHPTSSTISDFTMQGFCFSNWDCVNDQAGNAGTGTPANHDGIGSMALSTAAPARELYGLDNVLVPAGKVVTEIEIAAQLARSGALATPTAQLVYERQGTSVIGSPLTISNMGFQEFRQRFMNLNWTASDLDSLEIGLDHMGGNDLQMTQIFVKVTFGEPLARPVEVLTAAASGDSTTGKVMLNWLNPSYGLYSQTMIRRVPGCPALPTDGIQVASASDGLGKAGTFVDNVPVGSTYHYAAFVEDAENRSSKGVCVSATPFDRNVGKVEWVYDTTISSLTTPGLRVDVPASQSVVYSVSNDGLVHAIRGGSAATGGGTWPAGWTPFRIGGAAQSRPPVVLLPPPTSRRVLFLGGQDGHAYAIDAITGELIWKSLKLGGIIQAAPGVALGPGLVFVGTRDTGQPNRFYALRAVDGTVAWSFDDGGIGIGRIVSGPTVDTAQSRVYFTSAKGTSGKTVWCLDYGAATPPGSCWLAGFGIPTSGGGDAEASPILFQNSLFVSENNFGELSAINPPDGAERLVFNLGNGGAKGFVFPQFFTTNVFASTATETYSIDTVPGSANWSASCVMVPSTPIWVPGTDLLFLGSGEGKLFQYSAGGGSGCPTPLSLCVGDCTSTSVGAPTYDVLKSMLYAGTDEGKIYGVRTPF